MTPSKTFDYASYFEQAVPPSIRAEDAWKVVYRHLLYYLHRLPHIIDANELKKETWGARARQFQELVAAEFGVEPDRLHEQTGLLFSAHETHSAQRVQVHNVVGTGFEYLLRVLLERLAAPGLEVYIKRPWTELPGYDSAVATVPGKPVTPDVAVVRNGDTTTILLPKWTIRHDRLENAKTEAQRLRNHKVGKKPHIHMVTSEFGPGRLSAALSGGDLEMVYHVNAKLLIQVIGDHESAGNLKGLIEKGQLKDLSQLFREV